MEKQISLKTERLKYICAVVLFGTIGAVLRLCDLPSEIVVLFRGIIGSTVIYSYIRMQGRKPDAAAIKKNLKFLVLSGVCLGLNWVFLFAAYLQTTVAVASLCNYMAPITVLLLSPLVLKEPLTRRKIVCIIAAFAGIVFVSGVIGGSAEGVNAPGIILGLLAAVCFVIIVFCNRMVRNIDAYDKSVVQLAVSAVTVLPYVLINNFGKTLTVNPRSVLVILVLGVIHTGLAYCFYLGPMETLPVQTVTIFGYLEPVVSVLLSALFLHENMTVLGWAGAVLILGAAVISELPERKTEKHS